ncbi:MAG TPA: ATP-binding protein [Clostridia bacterium]|nr:ATP-binding protein [Clostridia bacterium]
MLSSRRLSISRRLTLTYSLILFSILLVFTILTVFGTSYYIMEFNEYELEASFNTISDYISNTQSINRISLENLNLSYSVLYSIFDSDKQLIYSNKPDMPFMEVVTKGKFEIFRDVGIKRRMGIVYTNKPVDIRGTVYYIQTAKGFEDIFQHTDILPRMLFLTTILGTVVSYISGSILSRRLLKPIHDITRTAKEITSKNLDKRIPFDGPDDELKDLANTFNSMIGRLETDFERQRRFVSDVSHELRTPLSIIHGHVNMLGRWGKNDQQVLEKSLKTIKTETDNMNRLIENMLYLAKGDSNVLTLQKEEFSLSMLLHEVVEETLLANSQFSIEYSCGDELVINGDYTALKQVLRILMDNSIKFSNPPGEIHILGKAEEGKVLVKVSDKGMGIPKEALPYIFDRFYRVDESRNKATGGSGLGLAIAKQIVQSHNGTIIAESEEGKGTSIAIYLPIP